MRPARLAASIGAAKGTHCCRIDLSRRAAARMHWQHPCGHPGDAVTFLVDRSRSCSAWHSSFTPQPAVHHPSRTRRSSHRHPTRFRRSSESTAGPDLHTGVTGTLHRRALRTVVQPAARGSRNHDLQHHRGRTECACHRAIPHLAGQFQAAPGRGRLCVPQRTIRITGDRRGRCHRRVHRGVVGTTGPALSEADIRRATLPNDQQCVVPVRTAGSGISDIVAHCTRRPPARETTRHCVRAPR